MKSLRSLSLVSVLVGLAGAIAEQVVRAAPYAETYLEYLDKLDAIKESQHPHGEGFVDAGPIPVPGAPDMPAPPLEIAVGADDNAIIEAVRFRFSKWGDAHTAATSAMRLGLGMTMNKLAAELYQPPLIDDGGPLRYQLHLETTASDRGALRLLADKLGTTHLCNAAVYALRLGCAEMLRHTVPV